ncbi:MAG: 3-hydroxyacyl-CoA dehydrogenase family protein [Solirubrobacteraceae bacterium]
MDPDVIDGDGPGLRRATIVGAGRMGLGIAESFITESLDVTIVDVTPERCAAARDQLRERMRAHAAAGLIDNALAAAANDVATAPDIESAMEGADLVVEAVTEDLDVKRDVLTACDAAAPVDAIIASNTSSLDINALAGFVARSQRFLGMHWFNPPEWTPGVEVIPAENTDPAVVAQVVALLRSIGKRPSVVSGGVGFIANRLQMALFCEAARCVEEGLATPRDIDEVVRSCFGFRLPYFGPFQIADMAGLDVYKAVIEQHQQGLGDRFEVPDMLSRLVGEGRLGTASGSGFYDYAAGGADGILVERDRRYAALSELLRTTPPLDFVGGGAGS